ncbi:MAG: endonuclease/exonuclease/phosphatase family protein [Betaproteobacteria bacterium]|nr:endonuclease/exonuclease/phosphatase family protein [Betaproteobacteria bacterium]
MTQTLTIATYNIHKGLSPFNRRVIIHEVRDRLHALAADIVFLQEVQGAHQQHEERFVEWPDVPHHEHLAEGRYQDIVYGLNVRHQHGHHGNAILSAFPIINWINRNVSHHRFERRGHLLAQVEVPGWQRPLTCVCIHLGLFQRSREAQIEHLTDLLADSAPDGPLIVAGDFNDWRARRSGVSDRLYDKLKLVEAFERLHGEPARTFPSFLPLLSLDRIYVRGLKIEAAERLHGNIKGTHWPGLSDHLGLVARLEPL